MDKAQLESIIREVLEQKMEANVRRNASEKKKKFLWAFPIAMSIFPDTTWRFFSDEMQCLQNLKILPAWTICLSGKGDIGRAERVIENVRVLGPTRKNTQVEISVSDCFKLGIQAPIRDSGDLAGSAGLTLVGPAGSVTVPEGAIIAARHIHMHPKDAEYFGVKDGDRVNVECTGPRGVVFCEVLVRVNENYKLEMHVDMDEANAASLRNGDLVKICD